MSPPRLVLVLGGTRSGKSEIAERLAAGAGDADGTDTPVLYLATAPRGPEGDGTRIAAHRLRRPAHWRTIELEGETDLARVLREADGETVLLDGLGAWVAGLLHDAGLLDDDGTSPDPADAIDGASVLATITHAIEALADAAAAREGLTVVVGEESGMAPVAATRGTRRWVDVLGVAHQTLAARADRVLLVVAGRAVELPRELDAGARSAAAAGSAPSAGDAPLADDAPPRTAAMTSTAAARMASETVRPDDQLASAGQPDHTASDAPDQDVRPAGAPDQDDRAAGEPDGTDRSPDDPSRDPRPTEARLHGDRMVPDGMVDFAVNVVAGDPPGWARQALQAGIGDLGRYPDDRPAAAALAARHGRPAAGVLPLGGAVEGFWRLAAALRPRHAAVLVPGFTESEAALRAAGARVTHVRRTPRAAWALDPGAVPEDCDLVVIGRPDNPTGALDPREAILRLRRPGRTVLVDEAFADFVLHDAEALADHRDADDGPGELVVLRSLTKALSVPGVRCGYLLASPEVVALARDAGPPWTCPTPALRLLEAYAQRPDACDRIAARTAAHRDDLVARLGQLAGVQVWAGAANFVLVRVPDDVDAVGGLHRHGLAVRPCTTFVGLDERYVRVAVRTPAQHARLTTALADVLRGAERDD